MADAEAEKLSDVEKRIDTLNARSEAYSSEALEQAGTVVFLDYYGRLAIERGFVQARQAFAVLVLIFRRLKFSRPPAARQSPRHRTSANPPC